MQTKGKTSNLSLLLSFTKGVKLYFFLALAAAASGILFSFLTPQVIRVTIDSIIGDKPFDLPLFFLDLINRFGGREGLRENLSLCAGVIVVCALLGGLSTFLSRVAIAHASETYVKAMRDRLFSHIQRLPFSWHVQNQTGDMIQRCTADVDVIRNFVSSQLLEVSRTVIFAAIAISLMMAMNVRLTLIAAFFIPLVLFYSTFFFGKMSKGFLAADEAEGEVMVAVQENLTGVRVVRAFGRERFELERFDIKNNTLADKWISMGYLFGTYWGLGDFVTSVQILLVIVLGAVMSYNGHITMGEFFVFVSYNQALSWPIRRLGRILSDMSRAKVSFVRIQEILDAPAEADRPDDSTPVIEGDIVFKNVTFSYNSEPVLKDVSFTVKGGSTFGILGNTGSGKSTIAYLIDRLYDLPENSGSITINGVDIRTIKREHLRKNIGMVMQEPFLFSKTIGENIAISRPERPVHDIRRNASTADIDESIMSFSKAYDTVVGERGVTLSGGQKQRVAIARALMSGAPIMIFDDSLSAVDLQTDARIREGLARDISGATVILISHRINTLMSCDNILVLEDGEVAELGTHEELVAKNGVYSHIYKMQSDAGSDFDGEVEHNG